MAIYKCTFCKFDLQEGMTFCDFCGLDQPDHADPGIVQEALMPIDFKELQGIERMGLPALLAWAYKGCMNRGVDGLDTEKLRQELVKLLTAMTNNSGDIDRNTLVSNGFSEEDVHQKYDEAGHCFEEALERLMQAKADNMLKDKQGCKMEELSRKKKTEVDAKTEEMQKAIGGQMFQIAGDIHETILKINATYEVDKAICEGCIENVEIALDAAQNILKPDKTCTISVDGVVLNNTKTELCQLKKAKQDLESASKSGDINSIKKSLDAARGTSTAGLDTTALKEGEEKLFQLIKAQAASMAARRVAKFLLSSVVQKINEAVDPALTVLKGSFTAALISLDKSQQPQISSDDTGSGQDAVTTQPQSPTPPPQGSTADSTATTTSGQPPVTCENVAECEDGHEMEPQHRHCIKCGVAPKIQCPQGHALYSGAKCCQICGGKPLTLCEQGHALAKSAKFCNRCGESHKKQETILP